MSAHPHIIRSKIRIPGTAPGAIERPRVMGIVESAVHEHPIVVVSGMAGCGKTTAVAQFAARAARCAWLTVDVAERSPSRFVAYLAAAVHEIDPDLADRIDAFMADGLAPLDCAALLAEQLPEDALLVIDDVHAVESRGSMLGVLLMLADALRDGARLILVARRLLHLDLSRQLLDGRVARVTDRDLAMTQEEVAALLAARDSPADAADVARTSQGWAAGIVFETVRSETSMHRDRADPFFSYLGSEVLDGVPTELRPLVIASSVLEVVTPHGLDAAGSVLGGLRGRFDEIVRMTLPGVAEPDGFRYHPRFREFLLKLLREEFADQGNRVRVSCANTLLADGYAEEAADVLFAAGAIETAVMAVKEAARTLLRRGDWDKLIDWCALIGEERLATDTTLRGLQVRALMMSRRQQDVAPVVERMRATDEFDRHLRDAPDVAAWSVWALHGAGDLRDLIRIAPAADRSPRCRSVRYILETLGGSGPPPAWDADSYDRVQPLHVALQSAEYYRGRFGQVERLWAAAATRGPVTATLARIYMVATLTAQGRLERARRELEEATPRVRSSRFIEFWQQVDGELSFAEGDHERGIELIRTARETSRTHGYRLADRAVFPAIEGKMLVLSGRLPEAVEVLDAAVWWCDHHGVPCAGEWARAWRAAAWLGLGDDPEQAAASTAQAIAGMEAAARRLELVAALVFLAEARWRLGDDDEHDRLLDNAHRVAVDLGSLTPLSTAVSVFPDVLARRLGSADEPMSRQWRRVSQVMRPAGVTALVESPRLTITTLGAAGLTGPDGPIAVPDRAVELAALVTAAGPGGVARTDALDRLDVHSNDPAAYLRQVVRRLRRALPPDVELRSDEGVLRWDPAGTVASDDLGFLALVAQANREVGETRFDLLSTALATGERGEFLPSADSPFATDRRVDIARALSEVRHELAFHHLAAGRDSEAQRIARTAVGTDPYDEQVWQILLRATAAAEGPVAIPPVYHELEIRLAEIGMEPSPTTRALRDRLRRGP